MSGVIEYTESCASAAQVAEHLWACNASFTPELSVRIAIADYAAKIVEKADRFEAWANGQLVGLLAVYFDNTAQDQAFITNVSVSPGWQGQGLASHLIEQCIDRARRLGVARIALERDRRNARAAKLYEKHGFSLRATKEEAETMELDLGPES
jgi:ribosomal protein S18 acetylase RimI-like enzyme